MDINLRVSTGYQPPSENPQSCDIKKPVSLPPDKCAHSAPTLPATSTPSPPVASSQTKVTADVKQNGSIFNLSAQVGENVSAKEPAQDLWVKNMMTEMKNLFESFTSSITKLFETFLGSKNVTTPSKPIPQETASPSTATSSGASSNTPGGARSMETFVQRSTRNLGNELANPISEERMRENIIMYQLYQKDEEAESLFKTTLQSEKSKGKTSDEAIKTALLSLEKTNKVARWESDWVYSLSFRAAQFDSDLTSLGNSSVKAANLTANLAIQAAERNLVAIATGAEVPKSMSIA